LDGNIQEERSEGMKKKLIRAVPLILMAALLVVVPLSGCASGTKPDTGKTIITVGMITDLTGTASKAGESINKGLDDWFQYINEEDPISGVELQYEIYDNRYDPGRTPLAFRWMLDKGADIIVSLFTQDAELLKPLLPKEQMPMLSASTTHTIVEPPGWVFTQSPPYEDIVETILEWINSQWSYTEGKPKIGAVGWQNTMGESYGAATEAYTTDNPDKFTWVGKEIAPMGTFSWFAEVERLKDCDYILSGLLGQPFATFVNQITASGYDPTMVINNPVGVEWRLVKDVVDAEALDGFILADYYPTWEDEDIIPLIGTVKENLHKYRPEEEEYWKAEGHGFIANTIFLAYLTGIIRQTVEQVGAENVDGEAIHEISQNFELNIEGYAPLKLTPTRRYAQTDLIFHRFDASDGSFVRVSDWVSAEDLRG
jgi:ABC-type branched-subunit amino acid transport system substrate-binding protein